MSCLPRDDDFWRDTESVVVPEQPPVAVYTNMDDEVLVRQVNDDEDVIVRIRPENVPIVVRALLIEVGLEGLLVRGYPQGSYLADPRAGEPVDDDEGEGGDPSVAKDPTGAERQRRYRDRHRNGRDVTRDTPTLQFEGAAAE